MKKIKQHEKYVSRMQTNFKNEADRNKQNKGQHQMPLNQPGFNPMMPPTMMHPQNKMPMMPNQLNYPMMNNQMPPQMGMMPPQMGGPSQMGSYPIGLLPMGMPQGGMGFGMQSGLSQKNPVVEMKGKIDNMYALKDHIISNTSKDANQLETMKKQCNNLLKYVLEAELKKSALEADALTSNLYYNIESILEKNDIGTILEFLKKPHELASKVLQA